MSTTYEITRRDLDTWLDDRIVEDYADEVDHLFDEGDPNRTVCGLTFPEEIDECPDPCDHLLCAICLAVDAIEEAHDG